VVRLGTFRNLHGPALSETTLTVAPTECQVGVVHFRWISVGFPLFRTKKLTATNTPTLGIYILTFMICRVGHPSRLKYTLGFRSKKLTAANTPTLGIYILTFMICRVGHPSRFN